MTNAIPRPEFPRPQFVRKYCKYTDWKNLNGKWQFEIDRELTGTDRELWKSKNDLSSEILVPFCPECKLSGIGDRDFMNQVWYKRDIEIPESWMGGRIILHFEACDYRTTLWINDDEVGTHDGGFVSFEFDITQYVKPGTNKLALRVYDDTTNRSWPSGKQSDQKESYGCMYTRTTGIWQTVWLESVNNAYISSVKQTPVCDQKLLILEAECKYADGMRFSAYAYDRVQDRPAGSVSGIVKSGKCLLVLELNEIDELRLWDLGKPELYDITYILGDDQNPDDCVESYFGMREVYHKDDHLYLNGRKIFQRTVLDQGYYPDSLMTAPSEEELLGDITRAMAMGFDGSRLHQKTFEQRFLYHCDHLGYFVWAEFGNWGLNNKYDTAWEGFVPEWYAAIRRDYNHPCVLGWIPFNETGCMQNQALVRHCVDLVHYYDPYRPVIEASGWAHIGAHTADILDWHDYTQEPEKLAEKLAPLDKGEPISLRDGVVGRPTYISEYGGIGYKPGYIRPNDGEAWGYGNAAVSEEEFLERLRGLTEVLYNNSGVSGFCYTQLTDIEQEQNGLYYFDRRPKFDPDVIKAIIRMKE